jgi:L-fuculose-phosphate aldolase
MLSFGLGFDEARASNIVLVDDDLQLLAGDGMVNPSNRFHLWIYRHRPNVTPRSCTIRHTARPCRWSASH